MPHCGVGGVKREKGKKFGREHNFCALMRKEEECFGHTQVTLE